MRASRRKLRLTLIGLGLILVGICAAITARVVMRTKQLEALSPTAAFIEGYNATNTSRPGDAERYFTRALSSQAVAPWAMYCLGLLDEHSGNLTRSIARYRSVPDTSAASLDARLGLLRVAAASPRPETVTDIGPKTIDTLEADMRHAMREDLVRELKLVAGKLAARREDFETARQVLQNLRHSAPGSDLAKQARSMVDSLPSRPNMRGAAAVAALVEEAKLLQGEGDSKAALAQLDLALPLTTEKHLSRYEVLLTEEEVQRANGASAEADKTLATVADGGVLGAGDVAVMRMLKRAWNKDDNDAVMSISSRLQSQYPQSPLISDMEVIRGSALAELKKTADAIAQLNDVAAHTASPVTHLKVLRQIAWLAWRNGEAEQTLNAFQRGATFGREALDSAGQQIRDGYSALIVPTAAIRQRMEEARLTYRDVQDETLHHQYWLAIALRELGPKLKRDRLKGFQKPDELLQSTIEIGPNTYYGLLAESALGKEVLGDLQPPSNNQGHCLSDLPQQLLPVLAALGPLRELSQREIDFHLRSDQDPKSLDAFLRGVSGERPLLEGELQRALALISLSETYGLAHRGVALAESLWKRPRSLNPLSEGALTCMPTLSSLAFPREYFEVFRTDAATAGIPVTFALAIARTESFFAPEARSGKNAQGLMQLLPETAKQLGMLDTESLFDPAVNIRLGTLYLAQLMHERGAIEIAAAAYNAGPKAIVKWLNRTPTDNLPKWVESISFPETRDYVKKVVLANAAYQRIIGKI